MEVPDLVSSVPILESACWEYFSLCPSSVLWSFQRGPRQNLSGRYLRDWNEYANVIEMISEPFRPPMNLDSE